MFVLTNNDLPGIAACNHKTHTIYCD